jgi:putative ABC transport system permease protein
MLNDLRYAIRMLIKNPGFTAVAVLTLAVSIGANSTLFSLVNRVLFTDLPFKEPQRLVNVQSLITRNGGLSNVSGPDYLDWKERSHTLQDLCAVQFNCQIILTGNGDPVALKSWQVSPNFLTLFGVPCIGPGLQPRSGDGGEAWRSTKAVVLSRRFWQQRFNSNPAIIGAKLTLNGEPREVAGVMPKTLGFIEEQIDALVPLPDDWLREGRGNHHLNVFARLRPGVTLDQARAEMQTIAKQLEKEHPDNDTGFGIRIALLRDDIVRDVRTEFLVLHGVVGFVLLIACVNVANLLLARSASRGKEIAVRVALGAGRFRLIRQLLTESVLLALLGGSLGILFACWGVELLKAIAPKVGESSIPFVNEVSIDLHVLAFTAGVSLLSGLVFGLVPAWHASQLNLQQALKESERGLSAGRRRHRLLNAFTTAEVALSLVVLVGAGLMVRSYYRALSTDPGFDPRNVLCIETDLLYNKYVTADQRTAFYERVLERVSALPGAKAVGLNNLPPLRHLNCNNSFTIEGRPPLAPGEWNGAEFRLVNAGYFEAMRIPLRKGRYFDRHDDGRGAPIIIINETLARRFFPNEDPIGKRISIGGPSREIVGIVGDERFGGLMGFLYPMVFEPYQQGCWHRMSFLIRTTGDPLALTAAVQKEILAVDKDQPVSRVRRMEDLLAESVSVTRFILIIFCIFAGVALLLAMTGVYGVMAYSVSQRTREIGIRMALGATARSVSFMVVKQGLAWACLGVLLGLTVSLRTAPVLKDMLYDTSPTDILTFAVAAGCLAGVATLACYFPARRAMRVGPGEALRCE